MCHITEAEVALFQRSCTQNCFFSSDDNLFRCTFLNRFLRSYQKKSAFKKPTTASRAISPQTQPQLYGTSYFLVRNTPTGQWLKRGREGGVQALKAHPPKGMTPRLTAEQKAQIPGLLAKGAQAYGFRGDVWTASRVAKVIDRTFGIRYHRDHVGRLLREAGWRRPQPIERATQRDEEAIKTWYEQRWPALKKKPSRKHGPSSGETKPAFICCQWPCGPGHPADRPPYCAFR